MRQINFCLEDFTGKSLSFCLSEIDKLDTLLNIKSVKIPAGEGTHKTLHLADELFAIDGCWRKEKSVFFRDVVSRLPRIQ